MKKIKKYLGIIFATVILVPVAILIAPFLLFFYLIRIVRGAYLKLRFYLKWSKQGKNTIFIYSDSPNWQEYIEENVIPRIQNEAIFLNWSERRKWDNNPSLEVKIFRHYGGDTEFNPLAIVFVKPWKIKLVRFFKEFKDYKHGKNIFWKILCWNYLS